ncbi:hypothetical protein DPMN_182455, partial [Dreissena polymorpha]
LVVRRPLSAPRNWYAAAAAVAAVIYSQRGTNIILAHATARKLVLGGFVVCSRIRHRSAQ